MNPASLPAFLLAVLVIAASPGPAMALIFQRAGLHGFRAAIPTVLGLELGLFLWALAAGAGLAALVAASEVAFWVLRVAGAAFLGYLGIRAIMAGWRLRDREGTEALPAPPAPRSRAGAFGEGVIVQLANPKAAVFLLAFYPQFLPTSGPVLGPTVALGLIQVSVETVLYLGLALAVGRASAWFSRTAIRRRLDYASGAVLLALGLRVALTSRA
ncbi:MAG: LysE family translocator [Candidatus Nanopelagicales bacterium]